MFEDGQLKVKRGLTTAEEVERVVPPPEIDDTLTVVNASPLRQATGGA